MKIEEVLEESSLRARIQQTIKEEAGDTKLVDDVVTALDSIDLKSEVMSGGDNFNVAFKIGDVEYYVRPNDEGSEKFYIDADEDGFDTFKVKDISALKSKIKEMKGSD